MGFTIDPSLPQVGQAQEGALMSIKPLELPAPRAKRIAQSVKARGFCAMPYVLCLSELERTTSNGKANKGSNDRDPSDREQWQRLC
jgi:hypothetical protein